jgi:hypothetical protein
MFQKKPPPDARATGEAGKHAFAYVRSARGRGDPRRDRASDEQEAAEEFDGVGPIRSRHLHSTELLTAARFEDESVGSIDMSNDLAETNDVAIGRDPRARFVSFDHVGLHGSDDHGLRRDVMRRNEHRDRMRATDATNREKHGEAHRYFSLSICSWTFCSKPGFFCASGSDL